MRFHRNIKMLRSQVDAAPFVTVFFLLMIFVLLGLLMYTPGVHVNLPVANDLPGTDQSSVNVTMDIQGRLYFENQLISETNLIERLRAAAATAPDTLTMIVHADKGVSYEAMINLASLARSAGIQKALLATMPRLYQSSPAGSKP